jgi:hypothetical protein
MNKYSKGTEETKYNGWTNYATWRVNLEIIDGTQFVHDDIKSTSVLAIQLLGLN